MHRIASAVFAALLVVSSQGPARAGLSPTYDRFGPLPETEFGGDGIANDAVAVTTFRRSRESPSASLRPPASAARP